MTYNYNNSILGDYLTPSGNNLIVENPIIISSGSINNTVIGNNVPSSGYFTNLSVNNVSVSVSGHTHISTDISDSTSFGRNILTAASYAAQNKLGWQIVTSNNITAEAGGQYIIPTRATIPTSITISDPASPQNGDWYIVIKPSGAGGLTGTTIGGVNYSSSSGVYLHRIYSADTIFLSSWKNYTLDKLHAHIASDITNFNSSVSGLLPSVSGSGYATTSFANNIYIVSVTGLQPSGNYSIVGHTHTSSDITNFNSSVSGLLPVKDIVAGSGISVSSSSGIYTIDANISGVILEAIQDNLGSGFLVAGTGVKLTYNDPANTLRLDNLHTEINELSLEPQGFVNRLDSIISFNDSTRTFTIAPSGSSYDVYIEGVKVTKTTSESIVIPTGTALNYLHFNTDTGLLDNKTTGFNFDTDVPIAFIHWNSDINQSTFFGEERHGIRMDTTTHKWIHNTFGMQYISGLSIGGYILLGDGSSNSHAQIDISDGTLYQEDIIISIADGDNGVEFTQQLSPIAYIPVYYHLGSTGQWVRDVSTPYPLKYNGTRALYNLYSGGTWTTPNVPNNRYFAMWIVATNDINDPILAIMGQREDSSLGSAENNNIWSDINLTNIPTNEIRPLYRLIFVTNDTFTNTPKSSLQSILDLRKSILTSTYGISQNDHGNLFGLGDDDHFQYVHINEPRTITANHTFTNGLTINNGLLNATSGSFTSLTVNGTGVSLNGHTHTSSDITDFNSSVSGLLPVKNVLGSGYVNVVSTSGNYTVSVTGLQPSGNYSLVGHTHNSSDITNFNSSVSGLLPSVSGIGYATTSFANNVYTVSVTGLQPSGNYSVVGHTHTSSNITDFNSSVSGLLPITNIVAGSNVTVSTSGTTYTISSSGTGGSGTTITNYSNNRLLTSDGTSTGIVAESGIVFNDSTKIVDITYDTSIGDSGNVPGLRITAYDTNTLATMGGRLIFRRFNGTESSPSGLLNNDTIGAIIYGAPNTSGIAETVGRILGSADGVLGGSNISQPSKISISTSSGPSRLDNELTLESDGQVYTNGYLTILNQSKHSLVTNSSRQQSLGVYSQPGANIGTSGTLYGGSTNLSPVSPTGNYNIHYYSTLSNIFSEVRDNVTNSGSIIGAQFGAWRNARGSNIPGWYDDNGTLASLYGISSLYGHSIGQSGSLGSAPTGVTPYTENAYGILVWPQRGYGTINYAYDLYLNSDNYQVGTINNHYGIYQASNNPNYFAGSISVDSGIMAPTPIYNHGTISGNVAINYNIDRQIQTMTLTGGSVNFTEGTGWTTANRSVDVVLHITVTSTTTVAFDSGFITDWYDVLPTFTAGTYMILIRSIGSTVIQGHYLGKKI